MNLTIEKAAEHCGITVEKLESIGRRSDCPKSVRDENGNWNTEVIKKMLNKMKEQAKKSQAYTAAKRKSGNVAGAKKAKRKAAPKHEVKKKVSVSYAEYAERFWNEEERCKDFCVHSLDEWTIYFVKEALVYGYKTAFPDAEVE